MSNLRVIKPALKKKTVQKLTSLSRPHLLVPQPKEISFLQSSTLESPDADESHSLPPSYRGCYGAVYCKSKKKLSQNASNQGRSAVLTLIFLLQCFGLFAFTGSLISIFNSVAPDKRLRFEVTFCANEALRLP